MFIFPIESLSNLEANHLTFEGVGGGGGALEDFSVARIFSPLINKPGGGGGTPHNGLYVEALPERGSFFRLQVYKRLGISQVGVYKRVGKWAI